MMYVMTHFYNLTEQLMATKYISLYWKLSKKFALRSDKSEKANF